MLTFPTCIYTLPKCLQLFKPSHYALFAYWVYFRPTALKCYFYKAIPDLYNTENPIKFFRKWRTPAFYNIFLMMPIICFLLTSLLGGTVTLLIAWRLSVPVHWEQWLDGGMIGIGLGMAIGMAFGMVGRVFGGVALSTMVGIVYGVTVGVLGGVSFSVALGVSFAHVIDGVIAVGAIFGVLVGMAFTLDLEIGIALSLAFAVMAALSLGAEFIVNAVFGVSLGALLARGMMSGAFVIGACRAILYPVQWFLAIAGVFRPSLHPIAWDELTILPLPFTRRILFRKLRENEQNGLRFLTETGRNLFRRAALKAVLYKFFHKHHHSLRFLYDLLNNPTMEEYLLVPVTYQSWEQYVSVRRVFLGELALRPVEAMKHPRFRRSAWWLNLRKRKQTSLTEFAGMLYDLLDIHIIQQEDFDLGSYQPVYSAIAGYPDGEEIVRSYGAMSMFLSCQTLSDLSATGTVHSQFAQSPFFHEAIRPAVLTALTRLGELGRDINAYFETETQQTQLASLARATGSLNDIHKYVDAEVKPPEQYLLQRIISQWQQLIVNEIGALGKSELVVQQQPESDSEQTNDNIEQPSENNITENLSDSPTVSEIL